MYSHTNTIDKPTQLVEVLQNKLNKRIDEGISRSEGAITAIQNDSALLTDFIAPLASKNIKFFASEDHGVRMSMSNVEQAFDLTPHSTQQIATRLGLQGSFVKNHVESDLLWKNELITKVLNDYLSFQNNDSSLVRTVGNEARAFLSTSYKRYNPVELYGNFLKSIGEAGAEIYNVGYEEHGLRVHFEALRRDIFEIVTSKGTIHVAVGVKFRHSDYGAGSFELSTFLLQPVCLNGMVSETLLKKIHLGRKESDELISQRTMRLETQAYSSRMNDIINIGFDKNHITKQLVKIEKAVETDVVYSDEIVKLEKKGLQKEESKELTEVLMSNSMDAGIGQTEGANLWKLAQGISAIARAKNEARKQELQEMSGELVDARIRF